VFLNSMADLWHDAVDTDLIARVFAVITLADKHTFQVLTKRPGRMHSLLADDRFWDQVRSAVQEYGELSPTAAAALDAQVLTNLWLGVSVESQKWAPVRLDKLAATTAGAVRFASCEPLLGELDLRPWLESGLDWVICGGESGPQARPMHPDWARSLRDQCVAAGVPFFFKQWGAWAPTGLGIGSFRPPERLIGQPVDEMGHRQIVRRVGKGRAGRELDERTWDEFPVPLTVGAGRG
jgi:protein gp37